MAPAAPPVEEEEEEEQEPEVEEEDDIPDLTSFNIEDMKQWVQDTQPQRGQTLTCVDFSTEIL